MAGMSKRHFEALAGIIRERLDMASCYLPQEVAIRRDCLWNVAQEVGSLCCRENPQFDKARFMAACGFKAKGD